MLGGTVTRGREELGAYAEAVYAAFPDFTATPFASGHRASLEWVLTGTYEGQFGPLPFGIRQQVEVRVAAVLELNEDGLIVQDSEYWDFGTVLTQLGAMPGVESAAAPAS